MTTRSASRRWRLLLLAAIVALVATACSGDDGTGSADTDADTDAEALAALGEPNPATGEPILVGYVYDGVTDAVDTSEDLAGAEATVEYVNAYLGGIGGRPMELDVCATDLDPAKATNCVAQFARDEVVAVLSAATGMAATVYPPLAEQGVPVFVSSTVEQSVTSNPNVFIVTNGPAIALGGPAVLAAEAGATRATLLAVDVPQMATLGQAAPVFYENAGVELDFVTVPPDAADLTPQVQAALSNDPGQFYIVGDGGFCGRAINALNTLGFDGQILILSVCADDSLATTAGDVEGVQVLTPNSLEEGDPEFELYNAVLDAFAPDDIERTGSLVPSAYKVTLGFARALSDFSGEATTETIQDAIAGMTPQPVPLGGGTEFQCNGEQVAIATSVCSDASVLVATMDADAALTDIRELDVSAVLELD